MPVKYIGRTTNFKGKSLWEILGNLKNHGVGRIIARSMFERYPEPSYIKILKVEALPNDDKRKVKVIAERTFRGVKYEKPITIMSVSYKTDYKLIPKDEETTYCKVEKQREMPILPRTTDFPPLYKKMLLQTLDQKGTPITEEPKLQLCFKVYQTNYYKVAEEGETPTVTHHLFKGNTAAPRLYENIKTKIGV
ncbi:28S ribosomal protein S34, mitochondrial [Athalia rosae]|uniref:28S ribosomal protein S34, mitochondrial n=1 Tax=Athalia rosae TaxID=37344 RepID=UPI002033FC40|nr:28S ribosomal protein S34, mitochondrial [Athalia rosae]